LICQATASPAPAQDVARRILGEDVTQIDYYTERVKRMVGKVLTGNGITRYERGTYDLVGGEDLSDVERDQLLKLCRQRLDAFRMQRGEEVFAHRSRHRWRWTTSCPGTRAVRTTSATCRPSASAAMPPSDGRREAGCVFCALEGSGRVLLENELALCIADAFPVTPGHSLVITRRHEADGLTLHQPEWNAVVELLKLRREQLSAPDTSISGWAGLLNTRGGGEFR
jgi:hypothetical protein